MKARLILLATVVLVLVAAYAQVGPGKVGY